MTARRVREALRRSEELDITKEQESGTRDENMILVNSIGQQIISVGVPIAEQQEANNAFILTSGDHGGFRLIRYGTLIKGVPGSRVTEKGIVEASCTIENMTFSRSIGETNQETLLHLTNNAKVMIRNCTFERRSDDPAGRFILIDSGCKAVIEGCVFRSTEVGGAMAAGTGYVVEHLSAVTTNVHVGLGFNLTGLSHLLTTAIVPELT
tara:strand:+ start:11325 stop:11951 length:627 start_codon:yes stop_codon:yes gene_type:complete